MYYAVWQTKLSESRAGILRSCRLIRLSVFIFCVPQSVMMIFLPALTLRKHFLYRDDSEPFSSVSPEQLTRLTWKQQSYYFNRWVWYHSPRAAILTWSHEMVFKWHANFSHTGKDEVRWPLLSYSVKTMNKEWLRRRLWFGFKEVCDIS